MQTYTHQSDPQKRARLRWRGRRGMVENDLFVERFFLKHEETLSDQDVAALGVLFELSDNDLLDLLLARKEPEGELATPDVKHVLALMRGA